MGRKRPVAMTAIDPQLPFATGRNRPIAVIAYPIVAARKIAGAEPNAILSSLSYLGEMTSEEFGKPDAARVG